MSVSVTQPQSDVRTLADVFIVAVDDTLLVGNRAEITGRGRIELATSLAVF